MAQRVESSVVVEAPVQQVYGYWQTLENLPNFMSNVEDITATGPGRTHWTIKGPFGAQVEFDAETTQDTENEEISWSTIGGDVESSGQVKFHDLGDERSRIEVSMDYGDMPGGQAGEVVSRFVANPQIMMDQDLQNFKEIMEGRATPEEIQQRPSAANLQSGLVAVLTSTAGLFSIIFILLFVLLFRSRRRPRKSRIVIEF